MKNASTNLIPIPDDDGQQPPGGIPPKQPNPNAIIKEVQTSFLEYNGWLFEEVYKDGAASFACWDGQQVNYWDGVGATKEEYVPITNDLVYKGAVSFPQQAQDYGSKSKLLDEIKEFIHKYVEVSPSEEEFASWYVLHTYCYDKFTVCPILRFMGDTGCGKSRSLEIIGKLCYKPIQMSGITTLAPIFRLTDLFKGTVIIDEADFKGSTAQDDIAKLLNCGFQRGTPVFRCDTENSKKIHSYDLYGPKVLATRFTFDDQALESRCITIPMEENNRDDVPKVIPSTAYADQIALKNKLLMYRLKNFSQTTFQQIDLPVKNSRLNQAFQPIANLVKDNPAALERFKRFSGGYEGKSIKIWAESPQGLVANALIQLVDSGAQEITPTNINEKIIEVYGDDFKKSMTAIKVGRILRSLGIEVSLKKVKGTAKRLVIIVAGKLKKLRKKYVVPVGNELTEEPDNEPNDEIDDEQDDEPDYDAEGLLRRYGNDSNGGNVWDDIDHAYQNKQE